MTSPDEKLVRLSRFIVRVPGWPVTVAFALLVAGGAGTIVVPRPGVGARVVTGVLVFGAPTVVATGTTGRLAGVVDAPLTVDRASLLSSVCEVAIVVSIVVVTGVGRVLPLPPEIVFETVIVTLALVFAFRVFVERLLFGDARWAAVTSATVQPLGIGVMLFASGIPGVWPASTGLGPTGALGFLVVTGAVYGGLAGVVFIVLDHPLQREFGGSLATFVPAFVRYLSGNSARLESFFAELGEQVVVPVTVLSFQGTDGNERARFVLPVVHPGPMKDVGGGKLPGHLAAATDSLVFPLHAMTGHDFDLVSDHGVMVVVEAAARAADRITYSPTATAGISTEAGCVSVLGQAFGDQAFLASTFSPQSTDDIAFSVGLVADAEARRLGFDDALVADAHNCHGDWVDSTLVNAASHPALSLTRAIRHAADRLGATDQWPLELGIAWAPTPWAAAEGIGPLGVRVALTRVNDRTTAYVLVDGNNMIPGLRERVIERLSEVDTVEVLTTDTHVVNRTTASNRVGDDIDEAAFHDLVGRLVSEARSDLAPVEAGMATVTTDVRVFGTGRTTQFAVIGALITSLGRALVAAVLVATLATTALVFHLLIVG